MDPIGLENPHVQQEMHRLKWWIINLIMNIEPENPPIDFEKSDTLRHSLLGCPLGSWEMVRKNGL